MSKELRDSLRNFSNPPFSQKSFITRKYSMSSLLKSFDFFGITKFLLPLILNLFKDIFTGINVSKSLNFLLSIGYELRLYLKRIENETIAMRRQFCC